MTQTYKVKTTCDNCGLDTIIKIKKGIKIRDGVDGSYCNFCGCLIENYDAKIIKDEGGEKMTWNDLEIGDLFKLSDFEGTIVEKIRSIDGKYLKTIVIEKDGQKTLISQGAE